MRKIIRRLVLVYIKQIIFSLARIMIRNKDLLTVDEIELAKGVEQHEESTYK